jgi:endoglucanase
VDDLGGVVSMLEALRRIAARNEPVDVIMLFTRAEEAGFRGALLLCMDPERENLLPNDSVVISVECSSQRATTPVGGGAVLRIGDRTTVFDPPMCRQLELTAKELAKEQGLRPLVRALMDGGTCEATAFNQFGYRAAGVCLPLGNYHNMDRENGRIAEEFISLRDADDLVATMETLPIRHAGGASASDDLLQRLVALARNAERKM